MNVTSLPYNHESYQSALQSWTLPVCHTIMNITSLQYNHERYQSTIQSWSLPVCHTIMNVTSLPYNHERYQSAIQSWTLPVYHTIMIVTSLPYNHEPYQSAIQSWKLLWFSLLHKLYADFISPECLSLAQHPIRVVLQLVGIIWPPKQCRSDIKKLIYTHRRLTKYPLISATCPFIPWQAIPIYVMVCVTANLYRHLRHTQNWLVILYTNIDLKLRNK